MQILKVTGLILLLSLITGCSCITRRIGWDDANIPIAGEGGPLQDVRFAFDSSSLDSAAKRSLDRAEDWLDDNDDVDVQIEGHCDERGTNEYNLALGERRARAVYDYLRSKGISPKRMTTISYGEELPLDPRHTGAAYAKNRRAHFSIK